MGATIVRVARILAAHTAAVGGLLLSPPVARAGELAAEAAAAPQVGDPAAPQALGRVFAAGTSAPAVVLASSGGYGYTESVLNAGDTHHRAAGSLAVEGRPVDWFGLGLRLDGRYDRHQSAQQGSDDGWVGDPRLFARVDRALGGALRLGGRLGIWLPGRTAPSVQLAAVTPELSGALTFAARGAPFWLTANGGYRLNRSARSATDAATLSAGDRLGLELSAYDQALIGFAAAYGGGRAQGFLELTAELMVGAGSPSLSASPLRAGAGLRYALTREVRLEAQAEAALGTRPAMSMSGPLVPVPPRAAVWLGVAYRFGAGASAAAPRRHAPEPPPPPPARVTLAGRVLGADGLALGEATVASRTEARPEAAPAIVDGGGRFTVSGERGQTVTVDAEAEGYEPASETVVLGGPSGAELTLTLRRRLPNGQIRGLVRSFRGVGLDAEIRIAPREQAAGTARTLRAEEGRFEADVAPGAYEVTITAPGYETQQRRVEVEQNGVTLLNADLRSTR
jgi:hypothetical protein